MKTTFSDLTEAAFDAHAEEVIARHNGGSDRKHAIAYLQSVISKDSEALLADRSVLRSRIRGQRKRRRKVETLVSELPLDFSRTQALFQDTPLTPTQIAARLTQDNTETFLISDLTSDLVISGDNVLVAASSNRLSAKTEALANTVTVTGDIVVSGSNTVLRGLNFKTVGQRAVRFTGACSNLTLEDCTFEGPTGHTDSRFWEGANGLFSGDVTVLNCRVEGYTSWMLADFSTESSGTPQTALNRVNVKRCYFKNNLGSMAARGKLDEPMKSCNFSNNKVEVATMHQYFWDCFEASGAVNKVIIRDNEFTGPAGTGTATGKVGFAQVWSKNAKPWTIEYSGNVLTNLRAGLKIAHNAGFYAPNQADEDFLIDISAAHTDVYKAVSFLYKRADGTTPSADKWLLNDGAYTPENAAVYPQIPPVINPQSYPVVAPP